MRVKIARKTIVTKHQFLQSWLDNTTLIDFETRYIILQNLSIIVAGSCIGPMDGGEKILKGG